MCEPKVPGHSEFLLVDKGRVSDGSEQRFGKKTMSLLDRVS